MGAQTAAIIFPLRGSLDLWSFGARDMRKEQSQKPETEHRGNVQKKPREIRSAPDRETQPQRLLAW